MTIVAPHRMVSVSMTAYQKLVRDRIPEIIQQQGKLCVVRTLDEAAYRQALLTKLVEEAREVCDAHLNQEEVMQELADVREVMEAIVKANGLSWDEINKIQQRKREARGGFEERLFLESAE